MKVKMHGDNCECWKAGDIFDVHKHYDGSLYINCNDPEAEDHCLMTEDGDDVFDIKDFDEGEEVE